MLTCMHAQSLPERCLGDGLGRADVQYAQQLRMAMADVDGIVEQCMTEGWHQHSHPQQLSWPMSNGGWSALGPH